MDLLKVQNRVPDLLQIAVGVEHHLDAPWVIRLYDSGKSMKMIARESSWRDCGTGVVCDVVSDKDCVDPM